jgi:quercetin dioxygenase-like cupin family protein
VQTYEAIKKDAVFVPPMPTVEHVIRDLSQSEKLSVVGIPTFVRASKMDTGGAFSLFETHDAAGDGPPLHIHRNEAESMLVLEGDYLLQVGGAVRSVSAGGFAHFPIGVPHTYKAVSPECGKLLIWTTPGGYEAFFRAADALARRGELDPRSLTECARGFGVEIVGPPLCEMR